ncbi:MAG: hypothetical protein RMK65_09985, partial [Anaerolineae bacterium]|nr:hypothetical protein [Anaerolineae bacterium]
SASPLQPYRYAAFSPTHFLGADQKSTLLWRFRTEASASADAFSRRQQRKKRGKSGKPLHPPRSLAVSSILSAQADHWPKAKAGRLPVGVAQQPALCCSAQVAGPSDRAALLFIRSTAETGDNYNSECAGLL